MVPNLDCLESEGSPNESPKCKCSHAVQADVYFSEEEDGHAQILNRDVWTQDVARKPNAFLTKE